MIKRLNLEELLNQDENTNWSGNKSFKENIVNKINEIIEVLNKREKNN